MKDLFPPETREAYLSGDVTPTVRATLRKLRLEFETTLYQFNDSGTVEEGPPDNPWWDPLGEDLCAWCAYQPKGATSYEDSLIDVTGQDRDGVMYEYGVETSHDTETGWHFWQDGDCVVTPFYASPSQTSSAFIEFTTPGAQLRSVMGSNLSGTRDFIILPWSVTGGVTYLNGGGTSVSPRLDHGNLGMAGSQAYRNGVPEGTPMAGWSGENTKPMYIGGEARFCAGKWWGYVRAVVFYNCIVTDAQALAISTAMAAI